MAKKIRRSRVGSTFEFLFSSRCGIALIGFFGFVNMYALRVNLSIAVVYMINDTAIENAESGIATNQTTNQSIVPIPGQRSINQSNVTIVGQRCNKQNNSNSIDSEKQVYLLYHLH